MKNEIITLAQNLIQRESISPDDKGCQQVIAEILEKEGFEIEWLPFNDTLNLWATHGTSEDKENSPCVAFAGHTDVVTVGDISQWKVSPFSAEIINDMLYGRGAADMKGSLSAMVIAVRDFVKNNPEHKGKVALLITSDEEADAKDGTVKVVETLMQRNEPIHYCVVGEPSSTLQFGDVIKNGRRGSITGNLYIKGILGHVAYPHLAENPIHKALPMLNELANYQWDNGNAYFPATSLQIVNVKAGTGSNNVIPDEIYVQFNLRFSTEINAEMIKQKVAELLDKYALTYRIEWNLSGNPFLTDEGKLIDGAVKSIEKFANITPKLDTSGGTSDGRFIAKMGTEIIEFGPLNKTIHKANECVSCDDLAKSGAIYFNILEQLLK